MLPQHLLSNEVVILRHGVKTDRYGQYTADWKNAIRTYTRGFLGQTIGRDGDGGENNNDRSALITSYQLFVSPGTDIKGHDRVEVDGTVFEVVGPPLIRRIPNGVHHLEIRLRAVEG